MHKKRILLVDDDEDLRRGLAEQLALHEEFEPIEAGSATEGIDRARQGQIDMILLDVGLPDIDGREACRMMRKAGVRLPDWRWTSILVAGRYSWSPRVKTASSLCWC